GPWIDRGDRGVVRDANGARDHVHPRLAGRTPRRGDHGDLLAAFRQPPGKLSHVHLDATGCAPVVGAGKEDSHQREESHAGWNMCQSTGLAAIARSNSAARSRVSAATSSRTTPVRSMD